MTTTETTTDVQPSLVRDEVVRVADTSSTTIPTEIIRKAVIKKDRRDKENKTPGDDNDWRGTTASDHKPKSKGISPKAFHKGCYTTTYSASVDNNNDSNKTRSRPGTENVQQLHATAQANVLFDQKYHFIKDQKIKLAAYKEVTSLKRWPMQSLAFEDFDALMRVYRNEDIINNVKAKTTDNSAEGPDHQYGDSSSSCNSNEPKRVMKDKAASPSKSQQKNSHRDAFLAERCIPVLGNNNSNAPTNENNNQRDDDDDDDSSHDTKLLFDSGLWSMEPRVFSLEKADGKRKYLVGHLGRVMDFVWRKTDPNNRHCYEMILEKTPCRLYFDLEFAISDNPNVPTDELMNEFYDELIQELNVKFPDHTNGLDRTNIVDLDSSTPQKFSRHLIVHLPKGALFADTAQAGKFIKRFIQRLADSVATEQLQETRPMLQQYLFINPKGALSKNKDINAKDISLSQKTCFVDLGVYTRNRLFRLMGSSKKGKSPDCALRIAKMNEFPFPEGFGNDQFYKPAMTKVKSETHTQAQETVIKSDTNSDDGQDLKIKQEKEETESDDPNDDELKKLKVMTDWSTHAEALCQTLVVPMNGSKLDYPILPEIGDASDGRPISELSQPSSSMSTKRNSPRGASTFSSEAPSFGASPYPFIDKFISEELANRGGVLGSIRSWTLDYGPVDGSESNNNTSIPVGITYSMLRNRWCECIGRSHKSNNVIWNVSFNTKQCVQSCYDPDCRASGIRGKPVDLPLEAVLELDDALFEAAVSQMDDNELLAQSSKPVEAQVKKISAAIDADLGFDGENDAELEKAMLALHFDEPKPHETPKSTNEGNNQAVLEAVSDPLSDDALLDAIFDNPELFP